LYLPEGINNVAAYLLLLIILIVRPQGLFGIQSRRRV
jgi:branched-subunit amino acid ABC-type transport system permease component